MTRSPIICNHQYTLLGDQIKDEMGGSCGKHVRNQNCIGSFCRNRMTKDQAERPTSRKEDNIKKVLNEMGWEGVDWINLAQDR